MLTHVHKVIHLVVGTFEQGLGTSLAPYIEKMKVTLSDRTLVSVGPARPISRSSEDTGVGLWPDAGSLSDQTLEGCVLSCLHGSA